MTPPSQQKPFENEVTHVVLELRDSLVRVLEEQLWQKREHNQIKWLLYLSHSVMF